MNTGSSDSGTISALEMMPSGIFLPRDAVRSSIRFLIDATALQDEDIPDLVDKCVSVQLHHPYVKPVFLISALHPSELTRAGFIYETVLTETAWENLGVEATYREYIERRVYEMIKVYMTSRSVAIKPGEHIPRWLFER